MNTTRKDVQDYNALRTRVQLRCLPSHALKYCSQQRRMAVLSDESFKHVQGKRTVLSSKLVVSFDDTANSVVSVPEKVEATQ